MAVPNVELWTVYLNYIRRRNDTLNDPAGTARKVITQAYEFVLNNIGVDKDSGKIWQDYVQFIRSGPGTVGGSSWQDQTKMDQMRKAFHRAIGVPTPAVTTLWREYEQFESGLNKTTVTSHLPAAFLPLLFSSRLLTCFLPPRRESSRQNATQHT